MAIQKLAILLYQVCFLKKDSNMAGYGALAPALAGGPPGWVIWAVGGTALTIGAIWAGTELLENEREVTISRAEPRVIPKARQCAKGSSTQDCPNNKRYGARVHAQGVDCGGESGSTIGAPGISRYVFPVTVLEGITLSDVTWAMLTKSQKSIREIAKAKADAYIITGPASGGRLGKKTFPADDRSGGKRYDVDTFGDGPSFIS
ncbi:hypothetical protein [Dyadobacter fanqingshengii]|uniref:Uncharacterized protein n=1 Tax=Dyadobacter fanqingshengii TaxID=2906443 RepID=A0A9X1PEB7_9BACT|nr:hypothetical protein [Dyadobacter fanqingshengii]MCF0043636.1 hypothetical protein [Dyadobacter fanqingshengii]USJ34748.2 hypothetical protein NFI81_18795 [Dyadobacter fanqingshengii]